MPTFIAASLQQAPLPDTLITRVVPDRGIFEYASGTLEIVVLFMAALTLGALVWALVKLVKILKSVDGTIKTLVDDARPILRHAAGATEDARKTIGRLREDVERVTDAAANVSEQLLDAAEVTARRIDEVNAVLDVLQDELETTAISSVAALRGVRVGATEMASALGPRRGRKRRRAVARMTPEEVEARRLEREMPGEVEPG